jgi:hypothetical protein
MNAAESESSSLSPAEETALEDEFRQWRRTPAASRLFNYVSGTLAHVLGTSELPMASARWPGPAAIELFIQRELLKRDEGSAEWIRQFKSRSLRPGNYEGLAKKLNGTKGYWKRPGEAGQAFIMRLWRITRPSWRRGRLLSDLLKSRGNPAIGITPEEIEKIDALVDECGITPWKAVQSIYPTAKEAKRKYDAHMRAKGPQNRA